MITVRRGSPHSAVPSGPGPGRSGTAPAGVAGGARPGEAVKRLVEPAEQRATTLFLDYPMTVATQFPVSDHEGHVSP